MLLACRLMNIRLAFLTILAGALPAAAFVGHFGPTGVTSLETARLNVFCDGSLALTPCDITFIFLDHSGNILKQASLFLQPETTGFLDYAPTGASFLPARVEISPCWTVLRGTAQATLEIFDNFTRRTRLLLPWSDAAMPRSGADVDFGAVAITQFDIARMGVFCTADTASPCDVTLEFHNSTGGVFKSARLSLLPGTSGHVDLHFSDTSAAGGRVLISPCWTVASGAAVLNFETVDALTGLTITHAYPAALQSAVP